jgi:hypothetical protein
MFATNVARTSRTVWLLAALSPPCVLFAPRGNTQSSDGTNPQTAKHAANNRLVWTSSFPFEREFLSRGRNPYFNLEPGFVTVFEGMEKGKTISRRITVLDEVELVGDVPARLVLAVVFCSIPIARSINPVDAVEFTGFPTPEFPPKSVFWTQMDADSGRGGHLGRDDSGIFHFSD